MPHLLSDGSAVSPPDFPPPVAGGGVAGASFGKSFRAFLKHRAAKSKDNPGMAAVPQLKKNTC